MATILFTDIVGSTALAQRVQDAAWKRTLTLHDDTIRTVLANFRGREVETAGDSFLIVFDGAEIAIRCGLALVGALAVVEIPIRVAIHTGDITFAQDHVSGLAVNTTPPYPFTGRAPASSRLEHHPRPSRGFWPGVRLSREAPSQGLEREHELFKVVSR